MTKKKNISTNKIFWTKNIIRPIFFSANKNLETKIFFLTKELFRPKNSCTQTIYSSYVTVSLCWFGLISLVIVMYKKKLNSKKILSRMGWLFARKISQRKKCSFGPLLSWPILCPLHSSIVLVKPPWACSWSSHEHLCSWKLHEHAHEALTRTCAWRRHAHDHNWTICVRADVHYLPKADHFRSWCCYYRPLLKNP